MQSSSVVHRESSHAPGGQDARAQPEALTAAVVHEAANDDAAPTAPEYRPNPLWAVNGAMVAFFVLAAIVLASG
jgi:hypothetical protein